MSKVFDELDGLVEAEKPPPIRWPRPNRRLKQSNEPRPPFEPWAYIVRVEYDDARVGARLQRERKAAGVTLRLVADRLGVTEAYVSYLENGHRRWHTERIVDYLLAIGWTQEEPGPGPGGARPQAKVAPLEAQPWLITEPRYDVT